jgi:hypothetical protein
MSERSRRRRRRRRGGPSSDPERETPQGQPVAREQAPAAGRSRRRRRGRPRGQERKVTSSPKSSEDLVRALPRERPATLTAPADGQTLEGLIGDLQSEYGVPQYPQEYRITLKVAEERERGDRSHQDEPVARAAPPPPPAATNGGPRREKAPSMRTAVGGEDATGDQSAAAPRKRSRRRRRRGRGGGSPGGAPGPS